MMGEIALLLQNLLFWVITGLVAVLMWFMKGFYVDFKEMMSFYTKHKDTDFKKILSEIDGLKVEVMKVELESKRYWNEQRGIIDSNHTILLEKFNHLTETNVAALNVIKELVEKQDKRIEKLESKP